MGNAQLYALLFEYADGQLLAETQNVTVTRQTGAQRVLTLAKGWSGVSPGAAVSEIMVEGAVPAAGFEFDAGKKLATLVITKLYTLGPGGKIYKGEVIIMGDTLKQGVGQPATYTFNAEGPLAFWT